MPERIRTLESPSCGCGSRSEISLMQKDIAEIDIDIGQALSASAPLKAGHGPFKTLLRLIKVVLDLQAHSPDIQAHTLHIAGIRLRSLQTVEPVRHGSRDKLAGIILHRQIVAFRLKGIKIPGHSAVLTGRPCIAQESKR